jgi:predicted transcriptional regulator
MLITLYVMAKQVFSTLIEPETLEKLRNLAWWSRKPITKITEQAILDYIKRYEEEHGEIQKREED